MEESKVLLQKLGLNSNEISIYLSLLKSGPCTIMNISNRLNINRTSVHLLVKVLIEKQILYQINEKKRRLVAAFPPENFKDYLDRESQSFKLKYDLIPNIVDSVYKETSFIKSLSDSQVFYYKGVDTINWLYEEILKSKEIRTYVNAKEIIKIFPENGKRFINAVSNGTKLWDFHHFESHLESFVPQMLATYPNFKVKILPKSIKFDSMDYLIYEGKIAIIYGFPDPHAIVIENPAFFEMSKEIYDFMWSTIV